MYHAISWDQSLISISPAIFRKQMDWLNERGYKAISLSRLINYLYRGKNLPKNTITLTFDDGFANLFDHVFPVLVRYNFSATIFLVSGYCGRNNNWPGQPSNIPLMPLLNWDQIREMDDYGIEFGAHTVTHPLLDHLDPDNLRTEILNSKNQIETQLSHKIDTFAYPYGRFNEDIKDVLKGEFLGACTTNVGLVSVNSDPFEINRVDANYVKSLWIFRSLETGFFPKYLYIRGLLRNVKMASLIK